MAGIVETGTGAPVFRGPARKRFGFGTPHIGFVSGQPEHPGRRAPVLTHREAAMLAPHSNIEEFQAVIIHAGLGRNVSRALANPVIGVHLSPQTTTTSKRSQRESLT